MDCDQMERDQNGMRYTWNMKKKEMNFNWEVTTIECDQNVM